MKRHFLGYKIAALMLTACFASTAGATTFTYADNKAGFLSATSAVSIGALPSSGGSGTVVGLASFTDGPSASIAFGFFSNEILGNSIGISGVENFNVSFSTFIYAIGLDIHEPSYVGGTSLPLGCNATCTDTTFEIQLLNGSTSVGSFVYNAPDDAGAGSGGPLGFWGVHSSLPFNNIRVRDVTNTIDNEFFGNFSYSTVAAIPEPATTSMVLIGTLLLFAKYRSQRKRA